MERTATPPRQKNGWVTVLDEPSACVGTDEDVPQEREGDQTFASQRIIVLTYREYISEVFGVPSQEQLFRLGMRP